MRFQLLGPLAVFDDDGPVALGGPKQRLVLAHLLLRVDQTVPAETLIDAVWGQEPPETARGTLQAYVSRLRGLLGADRLEGEAPGYRFRAEPEELDIVRFETLLQEVRNDGHDPRAAVGMLDEALELWRGPALADLAHEPSLAGEITRLDELRLVATEERIGARLDLGQHADVVAELEAATASHPMRERLWGQLILALYRSGRQADALAAFERARHLLADELGIDPSPDLRDLHQQVLRQDGSLQLPGEPLRGYRLLERIGEGAFGSVHRAIQPQVEREVAIKSIHAELANQPDFVRRFEREAQLVARLEHPHIVPLYDYWREPDAAYLVMRFLRGGSLEDLLDEGPLEPERAADLLDQIGAALAAAHRQGVVHRDVKPGNVLLDEEGNAYLSDFGIALETGAPEQTAGTMVRGTPAYLSPEQIRLEQTSSRSDIYALGIVLFEMLTAEHPFPGTSLTVLLDQHLNVPIPSARALRPELPPAVDAAIARATAKDPAARFDDVLELCAAFRAAVEGTAARAVMPGEVRNPYKGLRAFLEADSADFFGRELLTRRLLERVAERGAPRFLCVVGPSGSGKSSVVRAGLVPAIQRGVIPGSERWYVVDLLPGGHPLRELERVLLGVGVDPPPSLLEDLEADEHGLARAVSRLLPDPDAELLIVLDQLEELFTMVESEAERAHVLESLRVAAQDPSSRIRIVATLRADFFDQPLSVRGFGELLAARNEAITPMSPEELERAIVGPAERVGLDVEPGLVAAMVADVVDRPGALPLLQYALTEMADRDDVSALTLNAYRRIGGVSGALARRAEHLYDGLDEDGREACRHVFLRLVTIGEGSDDTRRRVRRSELEASEATDGVIESFGRHRLLSFDRHPATREPTIEIAHEALLHAWVRLRRWVDEARDDIRTERQLALAATEWDEGGRDPSFLVRGARLEAFASWAETTSVPLSALGAGYLHAATRQRDEESSATRAAQERERVLERRSLRRSRALVAVLTVAALVATTLTVVATGQRRRAEDATRIADAQRLAAESAAVLGDDPELAILLAIAAVEGGAAGEVLPEAEAALHRAVQASRVVLSMPGSGGVAFHPNLDLLATAQADGRIEIRDSRTGELTRELDGHTGAVHGLAFGADGRLLASAGEDHAVNLWDTSTWQVVGGVGLPDGTPQIPALSPDGTSLAVSFDAIRRISSVVVQRLVDAGLVSGTDTFLPGGPGVAFSADGALLATAGLGEEPAVVWDTASRERRWTLGSRVIGVAFDPEGTLLATAESDGAVRLWSLETGELVRSLLGHTGPVEAVDFGPDGERLASGGLDGSVRIWDVDSGQTALVLSGQGAAIQSVDFDHHGTRVAGGGSGGTTLVWDVTPGGSREVSTIPVPGATRLDVSSDGSTLLVGGLDGAAHLLDVRSGEELRTFSGHEGSVLDAAFSPAGPLIATAGTDGTVRIWDEATGDLVHTLQQTTQVVGVPVTSVAFGADGERLVSTGLGAPKVWDVASGDQIHALFGHSPWQNVLDATFAPAGDMIATGGEDGTVRVWSAETGELAWTGPHTDYVNGVAFDPSGELVASGSRDGTVRIWDARTGEEIHVLRGHAGGVTGLVFSPDGSLLATTSQDQTTRLWDAEKGRGVLTLFGHTGTVSNPVFFPDGRHLATVAEDGTIRTYTLSIDELLRLARDRVTRGLTAQECRQHGIEPCPA